MKNTKGGFGLMIAASCVAFVIESPAAAARLDSRSITSVEMEQYECPIWNTCPHYIIKIDGIGNVTYTGVAVVKKLGKFGWNVQSAAFARIVLELDKIGFTELRESYASKPDGCGDVWSDQSAVTFRVQYGAGMKSVFLYYGCSNESILSKLVPLAKMIDRETGVEALLGRGQGGR